MEPAAPPRPLDPDASSCRPTTTTTTTKTLSFPNGTLKKHHHHHLLLRPPPPPAADTLYRECLKNHAASLGGHALDGCGEFMPSPAANPADPTSLKCAACGCHRNFHRRLPDPLPHHGREEGEDEMDGVAGDGEDEDDQMDEEEEEKEGDVPVAADEHPGQHQSSSSPPPYFSSAPHMLLALSTGLGANPPRPAAAPLPLPPAVVPRKRFRTKFSPVQKGRMQELSERLGWRMQKRDEGLVEEWCREIGVSKGVFKVWMHNNKHNFVPGSSRRGEVCGSGAVAAAGVGGGVVGGVGGVDGNSSGTLQGVNSNMVNGSSSSS